MTAEAAADLFARPAGADILGQRWLTGRRNFNGGGGLTLTFQSEPGALRFNVDLRALAAVDTEPVQESPLGGRPPALTVAVNTRGRAGLEIPLGERSAFAATLGLDFHGPREDTDWIPTFSLGAIAGFL